MINLSKQVSQRFVLLKLCVDAGLDFFQILAQLSVLALLIFELVYRLLGSVGAVLSVHVGSGFGTELALAALQRLKS